MAEPVDPPRSAEPIIEPGLAICDPHHHYWNHPTRPYLLEQLHADTGATDAQGASHRVVSTVFVDCMAEYRTDGPEALQPVGETEFIVEAAERSEQLPGATIAGIVSFADLALGTAVAEPLEAHVEAGRGRFRGIRHATSWDPDDKIHNAHTNPPPGLTAEASFRKGFEVLGSMGLTFDAWMYHHQLPELVDLARSLPETTIVLDHIGGPLGIGGYAGRREEILAETRGPLAELATLPQVFLKVGGIGMSVYGDGWHKQPARPTSDQLVDRWGDHLRWCIDTFGPDRCMFESNFPVDKIGVDYPILWNAFKKIANAGGYSAEEKADLFHDTATRAYRL